MVTFETFNVPSGDMITTIVSRLIKVLPSETGSTVEDAEAEKVYVFTKNNLIKLAKTKRIGEVIYSFSSLIKYILKRDGNKSLKDKNIYYLRSLVVITKLLAECIEINWDTYEQAPVRKGRVPITFGETGFAKPFLKYHTVRPLNIDDHTAENLMEQLVDLKSESAILEGISVLCKGSMLQVKNSIIVHPYKSLIDEIDEYCITICRYLSASNWTVTYRIIHSKMLNIGNCDTEGNEAISCIDIFEMIYIDKNTVEDLFHDLWAWIPSLRNPLHRTLLLYFLSSSLQYWIFALPREIYEAGEDGSSIHLVSSSLFDYVYASIQNSKYNIGSIRFLTVLLCCFPTTFKTFITSNDKPLSATSKKLEFLRFMQTSIQSPNLSENALYCFALIASIGSGGFNIDHQYPISQYVILNYENITETFFDTFAYEINASLIPIFCDLFVAYALIDIKYSIEFFHQSELTAETTCYFTSGLRAVGEIGAAADRYTSIMISVGAQLRDIASKQSRLLLNARAVGNSSRKSLSKSQSGTVNIPILSNILKCFTPNPLFYLIGLDETNFELSTILAPIVTCIVDSDRELSDAATSFLFSMISEKTISQLPPIVDSPKHPVIAIYIAGFHAINSMAEKLIEIDLNDPSFERILIAIKDSFSARAIISRRFRLKEACGDMLGRIEISGIKDKMFTNIETAILIGFCSPDIEIFKMASEVVTYALEDSLELGDLSDTILSSPLLYNRQQYKEFNKDSFTITGNAMLQKRIRTLASQFTVATDGVMNAWELIYERFSVASQDQETFVIENRNYLGMLASLSECILATDGETNVRASKLTLMINELAQYTIKLLDSSNMLISNSAMEVLSKEFGNHLTHDVFVSLNESITKVVQSKNKERILKVSDLFISLINGVINKCIHGKMNLELIVLSTLYNIMEYLDPLIDNESITLRLKIRCIKLSTTIKSNENILNLKFAPQDSHNFLILILKWFERAALRDDDYNYHSDDISFPSSERKAKVLDHLLSDLALNAAKGATYMAKGSVIYVPSAVSEEDYLQAKSTVCANLFSLGVRALEKYSSTEDSSPKLDRYSITAMSTSSRNSDIFSRGQKSQKSEIGRYNNTICKHFIDILSNILKMNTDVGLKFALPLGYHKTPKVRSAFVNIFANILKDSTGGKQNADSNLEALMTYLRSNLSIAIRLCDTCPATEIDGLASALLNLFMTNGTELDLIKAAVKKEIQSTTRVVELLRRNSVATRMLTLYARKVGANYLSLTLAPVLRLFIEDPINHVFELSLDKIEEKNVSDNIRKFMMCLSSFCAAFTESLNNMPSSFKEICYTIRTEVIKKFPEASATSVGSFLILRFFCPAIVAPETNGLANEPIRRAVRRSLLLVAKIIQNMANGSLYSLKLPLLHDKMDDLNAINGQITQYLINAAVVNTDEYHPHDDLALDASTNSIMTKDLNTERKSEEFDKDEALFIHQFLYNHSGLVNTKVATPDKDMHMFYKGSHSGSVPSLSSSTDNSSNGDSWELIELNELVEVIGQPKQNKSYQIPQEILSDNTEKGIQLYNFMARNSARDFDSILDKRIVNEGVADDGSSFIILSLGSFDKSIIIEPDKITYRIFQILCKVGHSPYSFLIDCTGFNDKNSVDSSILKNLFTLSPLRVSKNCKGFIFFNCSGAFLPSLDLIISMAEESSLFNPSFIPFDFLCSFDQQYSTKLHGLSKRTCTIINDEKSNYSDILQFDNSIKDFVQVEMKVGREYVHVCKIDPVPIICGGKTINIRLYDTYHATAVKGAMTSHKIGRDTFVINFNDAPHSQIYSSPLRNEIVRNVNVLVTKFIEDSSSTSSFDSPTLDLQDVISIIGNIGMFGLNAEDKETRNGAYNIISALANFYFNMDFEIGEPRNGVYVPPNAINHFSGIWEEAGKSLVEWCYPYCKCFTNIFLEVDNRMQSATIYIIEHWVELIYKVIYKEDKSNGPRKAKTLIRGFVNILNQAPEYIAVFKVSIWGKLFESKELIPMIVDIIISAAIDKQESGEDCNDILSILLQRNSDEIFKILIYKAINLTQVPVDAETEAEKLVFSSISWNEVLVLLKALITLSFDALELVWKYLPELCFIGSMFVNNGTYEVKLAVQRLAIIGFSNFSSIEGLSVQSLNKLDSMLTLFASNRGNLLFGVDTNSSTDENLVHTVQMLDTFTELVGALLAIFDIAATDDEAKKKEWRSKWAAYVMDEAFKKQSFVKARAISVLGLLIEEDQAEMVILELETLLGTAATMIADNVARAVDLNLCVIFCGGKVASKLPSSSPILPILFWHAIYGSQFPYRDIFIASTNFAAHVLQKMTEADSFKGDLVGILTRGRDRFEPYPREFEDISGVKYSAEMFDNYISNLFCRGLFLPDTRYHTLHILETFLKVRLKSDELWTINNIGTPLSREEKLNPSIYRCYLYLFSYTEGRRFKVHSRNTGKKSLDIGSGVSVPENIAEFLTCGSDQSIVALYTLAKISSNSHVDENIFQKGILWNITFFSTNVPELREMVISMIFMHLPRMLHIMEQSSNQPLVDQCQKLSSMILIAPELEDTSNDEEYVSNVTIIPKNYGLEKVPFTELLDGPKDMEVLAKLTEIIINIQLRTNELIKKMHN